MNKTKNELNQNLQIRNCEIFNYFIIIIYWCYAPSFSERGHEHEGKHGHDQTKWTYLTILLVGLFDRVHRSGT